MSVLAIDIGSSRTKAVLASWDGEIREARDAATPHQSLEPGERSFPLPAVAETVESLVAGLASNHPQDAVDTLVFACLGTAMAPLDRQGIPLGPALAPADQRPQGDPWPVHELGLDAADLAWRTGSDPAVASFLLHATWWRREHPRIIERTHRFRSPRGYILGRWSDADAEDRAWASRTMLADLETGTWAPDLLAAAGLDDALLPPILPPTTAFPLSQAAITRLGLAPGAVAVLGAMDNGCSLLGAHGPDRSGLVNIVGTYEHMAGVAHLADARRVAAATGSLVHAHALPGEFVSLSRVPLGYLLGRAAAGDRRGLDALLERVPAEPGDTRVALDNDAVIEALDSGREPTEVLRALVASAVDELVRFADAWRALGRPSEPVAVVGGGARHESILRLKATRLRRRLTVLTSTETAAVGALRLAAMAVRGATLDEACRLFDNPVSRVFEPATGQATSTTGAPQA